MNFVGVAFRCAAFISSIFHPVLAGILETPKGCGGAGIKMTIRRNGSEETRVESVRAPGTGQRRFPQLPLSSNKLWSLTLQGNIVQPAITPHLRLWAETDDI